MATSTDIKNNDPSPPMSEHEALERGFRHVARAAGISLGILFAGMTSCGIVSQLTDESDYRGQGTRFEGQAKLAEAEGKKALAEIELTKVQNASIIKLIEMNVDPITARCTILGWSTDANKICLKLVEKPPVNDDVGELGQE